MEQLNRNDVLKTICRASLIDNLGLLIGAGFTKALTNNETRSWRELIDYLCKKTGVDKKILNGSYPEITSQICRIYADREECSYEESVKKIKTLALKGLDEEPSKKMLEKFKAFFDKIKTSWIVTTNYDLNLETILSGKSISIDPNSCFFKIKNIIPIYHIHGIMNDPKNIVLTNEDYISLFRPGDYRQARLPFLFKESTVLMIGYSLSDFNVISSLNLANNVYTNVNTNFNSNIIQVIRKDSEEGEYKKEPYINDNGVIIIETDEIVNLFEELESIYNEKDVLDERQNKKVMERIEFFQSAKNKEFNQFIDDENYRKEIIHFVASLNLEYQYIYPAYMNFLDQVGDVLNQRELPNGAFDAYNEELIVLLDILADFKKYKTPNEFVRFIFSKFAKLAPYIGNNLGQSYSANQTWRIKYEELPEDLRKELNTFSETSQRSSYLKELLHN